jgi:hypothetical protein
MFNKQKVRSVTLSSNIYIVLSHDAGGTDEGEILLELCGIRTQRGDMCVLPINLPQKPMPVVTFCPCFIGKFPFMAEHFCVIKKECAL